MPRPHPAHHLPEHADLSNFDRPALLDAWRAVFREPPPKRLSAPFLRRFITFELQARRKGGLPKTLARHLEAAASPSPRQAPTLKPGGRLLREWNGITHTVDVVEDGYLWRGERYRSLSAIARAITGAHWSGPRFFGLKDRT